jgi:hypothetical protein
MNPKMILLFFSLTLVFSTTLFAGSDWPKASYGWQCTVVPDVNTYAYVLERSEFMISLSEPLVIGKYFSWNDSRWWPGQQVTKVYTTNLLTEHEVWDRKVDKEKCHIEPLRTETAYNYKFDCTVTDRISRGDRVFGSFDLNLVSGEGQFEHTSVHDGREYPHSLKLTCKKL